MRWGNWRPLRQKTGSFCRLSGAALGPGDSGMPPLPMSEKAAARRKIMNRSGERLRRLVWEKMARIWKTYKVLLIAAAAALLSMLLAPPSAAYLGYLDFKVLALLFSFMMVVAGLGECGFFTVLAQRLLSGRKQLRRICLLCVLLSFFLSMMVTNDVALITLTPFTIGVLRAIGRQDMMAYLISLQTVAANLGSMATPVGNPQNLYLYAHYELSFGEFFALMAPLTLVSLAAVCLGTLWIKRETLEVRFSRRETIRSKRELILFTGLFLLCLAAVFQLIAYQIVLALVVVCLLIRKRQLFARVDYALLLTFVCFFIFAGNIGQVPAVHELAQRLLAEHTMLGTVLASQVISNVPAAILFSGFSDNWTGLLAGANIGGLGTLIASLASLISFGFYTKEKGARPGRYLLIFTLLNAGGLALLLAVAAWMGIH